MTLRGILAAVAALSALALSSGAGAEVVVPELGPGDRGPDVRFFQGELNDWYRYARPLETPLREDGIFGPRTSELTRDFERVAGIAVDGRAELVTWRALYRLHGEEAVARLRASETAAEWPLPVPQWFWPWARWYLHRSEFRDRPFRGAVSRPNDAPLSIPEWAWRRMTALTGRPLVDRADHYVEDVVQRRFARPGERLPEADATVRPQRRSRLDPGWMLLTASFRTEDGPRRQAAVWVRLVRDRWVAWQVSRLGEGELAPELVPCDLKPAFAEAVCVQAQAAMRADDGG